MNRPSAAQLEKARRLLLDEGAAGSAGECAPAAGRVYDKLHGHLDPLLGAAGVQALLVRSAKLTQRQFSFLGGIVVGRPLKGYEGILTGTPRGAEGK